MIPHHRKSIFCRIVTFLVVVNLVIASNVGSALAAVRGHSVRCRYECSGCATPHATEFVNGNTDGALHVLIAGESRNRIEIYFNDSVFTDQYARHSHLNQIGDVAFSTSTNPRYAAFSLRYGNCCRKSHFAVYGVPHASEERRLVKITNDRTEIDTAELPRTCYVSTDPRYDVHVTWVSSRVVRIGHGYKQAQTMVLRFDPENEGTWEKFDGVQFVPVAFEP
jgi:hypothetical protein